MSKTGYEPIKECYLCHRNGNGDPLDKHHVFGGPNRKLSTKYGAVVYLCHDRCHENGPEAVHRNAAVKQKLQCEWQERLMEQNGWDIDDFRLVFGKSYLQTAEERAVCTPDGNMLGVDEDPSEVPA